MIITIVTVAALIAVTIYGLGQRSKLKIAMEEIAVKESVNDLLRSHTNRDRRPGSRSARRGSASDRVRRDAMSRRPRYSKVL